MSRLRPFKKRVCPVPLPWHAWKIQLASGGLCSEIATTGTRHDVDYKLLPRATSSRKRVVRNLSTSAARTRPESTEVLGKLLARELHDGVAQTLSTMLLDLENFRAEQYGRVG